MWFDNATIEADTTEDQSGVSFNKVMSGVCCVYVLHSSALALKRLVGVVKNLHFQYIISLIAKSSNYIVR